MTFLVVNVVTILAAVAVLLSQQWLLALVALVPLLPLLLLWRAVRELVLCRIAPVPGPGRGSGDDRP